MQHEIEDAVNKDRKYPACRPNRNSAAEIILGPNTPPSGLEYQKQKRKTDHRSDQTRIGEHLKIVVVSLLDAFKSAEIVKRRVRLPECS